MRSLEEIIAANAVAGNDNYMRKFIVDFPEWATKEYIASLAQNHIFTNALQFEGKDKRYLVTVIVEEV